MSESRALAVLVLCSVTLFALPALAEPVSLEVLAPASCAVAAADVAAGARALGSPIEEVGAQGAGRAFRVVVAQREPLSISLQVEERGAVSSSREIPVKDCAAARDAAALLVSLAVRPDSPPRAPAPLPERGSRVEDVDRAAPLVKSPSRTTTTVMLDASLGAKGDTERAALGVRGARAWLVGALMYVGVGAAVVGETRPSTVGVASFGATPIAGTDGVTSRVFALVGWGAPFENDAWVGVALEGGGAFGYQANHDEHFAWGSPYAAVSVGAQVPEASGGTLPVRPFFSQSVAMLADGTKLGTANFGLAWGGP